MPLFMENRFQVIIILTVFLTLIYGAELIVLNGQNELDNPDFDASDIKPVNTSGTSQENVGAVQTDIIGMIVGFFAFLTFAPVGMPAWAFWVVALMITVVWFTLTYVVFSIVYDFIKALPFT